MHERIKHRVQNNQDYGDAECEHNISMSNE